jgi:hypothetical protein
MNKSIIIDVSPYIAQQWVKYNGDLNKKQWLKNNGLKNQVINYIKSKLCNHNFYTLHDATYRFKIFDSQIQDVIINIKWSGKENIEIWKNQVQEDYISICSIFAGRFIVTKK